MSTRAACVLGLVAGLATLAAAGCSIKNPDFCCSSVDSCRAVGAAAVVPCTDPAQPVCDDEGAHGPARACIADPGGTVCAGPADCGTPARPVCDVDGTGTCVGCADADDCVRFAAAPHCDPASMACVACVTSADCSGPYPVCGADNTCHPCASDGECAAGVCAQTGACPPTDQIIYVDGAAPAGNAACTMGAPCRTIAAGVALAMGTRRYLKLAPGNYAEQVLIDGRTLEIAGTGSELTSPANPVVEVRGTANLTVTGLRIRGGAGRGLRCADSTVAMRGGGLEGNGGRGVETSDCTLTVERARVLGNVGGGLLITGGRITIRNSFIGKNGSPLGLGGVSITNPIDLDLEFNTIADNVVGAGATAGLTCQASTSVIVSNNIIVGETDNQVMAASCAPTFTLSNQMITGTANVVGRPTFVNQAGGDYHLVSGSLGIDLANPTATVTVDIDNQPRPSGARSDLGADEL